MGLPPELTRWIVSGITRGSRGVAESMDVPACVM